MSINFFANWQLPAAYSYILFSYPFFNALRLALCVLPISHRLSSIVHGQGGDREGLARIDISTHSRIYTFNFEPKTRNPPPDITRLPG